MDLNPERVSINFLKGCTPHTFTGNYFLTGPGTIDWDAGISKSFNLTEHAKLRVEVSFVNVMNHLNLGNPNPHKPQTLESRSACRLTQGAAARKM